MRGDVVVRAGTAGNAGSIAAAAVGARGAGPAVMTTAASTGARIDGSLTVEVCLSPSGLSI
jgi:hypothetical protein